MEFVSCPRYSPFNVFSGGLVDGEDGQLQLFSATPDLSPPTLLAGSKWFFHRGKKGEPVKRCGWERLDVCYVGSVGFLGAMDFIHTKIERLFDFKHVFSLQRLMPTALQSILEESLVIAWVLALLFAIVLSTCIVFLG